MIKYANKIDEKQGFFVKISKHYVELIVLILEN